MCSRDSLSASFCKNLTAVVFVGSATASNTFCAVEVPDPPCMTTQHLGSPPGTPDTRKAYSPAGTEGLSGCALLVLRIILFSSLLAPTSSCTGLYHSSTALAPVFAASDTTWGSRLEDYQLRGTTSLPAFDSPRDLDTGQHIAPPAAKGAWQRPLRLSLRQHSNRLPGGCLPFCMPLRTPP